MCAEVLCGHRLEVFSWLLAFSDLLLSQILFSAPSLLLVGLYMPTRTFHSDFTPPFNPHTRRRSNQSVSKLSVSYSTTSTGGGCDHDCHPPPARLTCTAESRDRPCEDIRYARMWGGETGCRNRGRLSQCDVLLLETPLPALLPRTLMGAGGLEPPFQPAGCCGHTWVATRL